MSSRKQRQPPADFEDKHAGENKSEKQPSRWGVFHSQGVAHYAEPGSINLWETTALAQARYRWSRAGLGRGHELFVVSDVR